MRKTRYIHVIHAFLSLLGSCLPCHIRPHHCIKCAITNFTYHHSFARLFNEFTATFWIHWGELSLRISSTRGLIFVLLPDARIVKIRSSRSFGFGHVRCRRLLLLVIEWRKFSTPKTRALKCGFYIFSSQFANVLYSEKRSFSLS
jgi:hypothetical protein